MTMCVIFAAMSAAVIVLGGASWWLLALVVTVPLATTCLFSAVGVLYAKRRVWDSEQRQAFIAQHGTLDPGGNPENQRKIG